MKYLSLVLIFGNQWSENRLICGLPAGVVYLAATLSPGRGSLHGLLLALGGVVPSYSIIHPRFSTFPYNTCYTPFHLLFYAKQCFYSMSHSLPYLTLPRPPHFHVAFSTSISEPRYHNPHIILPANVYNVQRKALKKYEKRLWSSTRRREESGRWFWSQGEHFACVSFISIWHEAKSNVEIERSVVRASDLWRTEGNR